MMKKWTEEELKALDAREKKMYYSDLKQATYLGSVMGSYGDFNYYQLADGSYVFDYMSIGD